MPEYTNAERLVDIALMVMAGITLISVGVSIAMRAEIAVLRKRYHALKRTCRRYGIEVESW
jgi:hypothetical protein